MMVFLGYMFDEKVLKEVLRDEWLKIYDKAVSKRDVCADCVCLCVWGIPASLGHGVRQQAASNLVWPRDGPA